MHAVLHEPLPDEGLPAERVIAKLDAAVRPGLMAMNHGRFFGWVIGGSTPAGVAADWLVAAWDQNTAMAEPTPGVSALEAVTAEWLPELPLGLSSRGRLVAAARDTDESDSSDLSVGRSRRPAPSAGPAP